MAVGVRSREESKNLRALPRKTRTTRREAFGTLKIRPTFGLHGRAESVFLSGDIVKSRSVSRTQFRGYGHRSRRISCDRRRNRLVFHQRVRRHERNYPTARRGKPTSYSIPHRRSQSSETLGALHVEVSPDFIYVQGADLTVGRWKVTGMLCLGS